MIVTEEEAKTKRCQESFGDSNVTPEGHTYVGGGAAMGGAFGIATSPSMCIGSRCMAWRWGELQPDIPIFVDGESDDDFARRSLGARVGYCGKAGAPQEKA